MLSPRINDLRTKSYTSLDEVTILTNDEIMRMSDEEFERFMLKYEKPAPSGPPRPPTVDHCYYEPDPPIPPAVKPNAAPGEPPKPPTSARRKKKARPTIPQEEEMQRFF